MDNVTTMAYWLTQVVEHDIDEKTRLNLQCFASIMRLIKCRGKILTIVVEISSGIVITRVDFKAILESFSDWTLTDEVKDLKIPVRVLKSSFGN